MACRLPGGVASPDDFWALLEGGVDAITEIGPDRWSTDYYQHPDPKVPGKAYTFAAGVVDGIDQFDAAYFGISPREAAQMDPQQRILLEMAVEALEDGAQSTDALRGSRCGVYVGISATDYANRRLDDPASGDGYFMTGGTLSIAANRLSYIFDLRGPSLAIDTACSSSMVSLHHACQSLWQGETDAALVGGVNALLTPYSFIGFSKASMLSEYGRCRAFGADGTGYVRAEGGAVLYLKPLSAARRDGDPVRAVIHATGVNSDGRTRGMSLPSSERQEALLRELYDGANLDPARVAYIEAHGTGTGVGDPAEAGALGRFIGQARKAAGAAPLMIGSAKSNIGHLEPASGLAGMVKTVLSLEHGTVPPGRHAETLNERIPFDDLHLDVVRTSSQLPASADAALAGVNSFGFGGTNAHAVLGHAPAPAKGQAARAATAASKLPPLLLSARDDGALKALAARFRAAFAADDAPRYNQLWTAATRRAQHSHRLAVAGGTPAQMLSRLDAWLASGKSPAVVSDQALARQADEAAGNAGGDAGVALLFSGNGSQWATMGTTLLRTDRVAAKAIAQVDAALKPHTGRSVIADLRATEAKSEMALTEVAQPALFALQVGVLASLRAQGLRADAVLGHSVGEVAASYAAGHYDLETACRVIAMRSHAQASTRGSGKMAAAALSAKEADALCERFGGRVCVAAVNSPRNVTLSGDPETLVAIRAELDAERRFCRVLDLEYPFHSEAMAPVQAPLLKALDGLTASEGHTRFVSTVTGDDASAELLDAHYWWRNVREPVRMADAVERLARDGITLFVEVGPHPVLRAYVRDSFRELGRDGVGEGRALPTLKRNESGAQAGALEVTTAVLAAHAAGAAIDWASGAFRRRGGVARLPAYPWQHQRHWYETTAEGGELLDRHALHPLLGRPLHGVEDTFEAEIDSARLPWLKDHAVGGMTVMPASGFIEIALAACAATEAATEHGAPGGQADTPRAIEQFEILSPLALADGELRRCRTDFNGDRLRLRSKPRLGDGKWQLHLRARTARPRARPAPLDPGLIERQLNGQQGQRIDAAAHYAAAATIGLDYGPAFQCVQAVHLHDADGHANGGLVQLTAVADALADAHHGEDAYALAPHRVDGALQGLIALLLARAGGAEPVAFLPSQLERLDWYSAEPPAFARIRLLRAMRRSVVADFELYDARGDAVAVLTGFRFRRFPAARTTAGAARYVTRAHSAPHRHAGVTSFAPPPTEVGEAVVETLTEQWYDGQRANFYNETLPLFEAMVSAFAHRALLAIGAGPEPTTVEALAGMAAVSGEQMPLLRWLLTQLEDDGLAEHVPGEGWTMAPADDLISADEIWRGLLADFPEYVPEALLGGRAGLKLVDVLRGKRPDIAAQPSAALAWLRDASPTLRVLNSGAARVVERLGEAARPGQRLRVLEYCVGPDVQFSHLRNQLPTDATDYVFLCEDDDALSTAERLVADHGSPEHLRAQAANQNAQWREQGLDDATFDLVVFSHCLHAKRDPRGLLASLRPLLGRDGLLLVLERAPERLHDLVFGLDPDWWRGTVDQPLSRLRYPEQWQDVVEGAGFAECVSLSEPAPDGAASAYLLLASNPQPEAGPARQSLRVHLATEPAQAAAANDRAPLRAALVEHGYALVDEEAEAADVCLFLAASAGAAPAEADAARLLELANRLSKRADDDAPRLLVVTRGAAPVDSAAPATPGGALLWGLARVLANETPSLAPRLIDLAGDLGDERANELLVEELERGGDEPEVLLGATGRRILRVTPVAAIATTAGRPAEAAGAPAEPPPARLDFDTPGPLSNLRWQAAERREPGAGEIEIAVRATGLNFRDVMYAMGMLSDEAVEHGFAGANLGLECAGDVVRIGPDVSGLKVGDPVIAFARGCFANYVTTTTTAVAVKPAGWSYAAAATVPSVFFTVYYALAELARLQPGERILIHGAAGGVGLAAIQYARSVGAEVFATAGSPAKRDMLALLGVDHVLDSRSLDFADEVSRLTSGEGVDVVLNSLSGTAMVASLDALRPFGRFLELGKRDFYEDTPLGLRPFRNNISYFGIDADQLLVERPALASRAFREMMTLFEHQAFRPLVHRSFPVTEVHEAFRQMQQSRHVGKLVVEGYAAGAPSVSTPATADAGFAPAAGRTWLVTGGTRGFGLEAAQWLGDRGVTSLALLGRSAPPAESRPAIEALRADGISVQLLEADVGDRASLARVLATLDAPLGGVLHAAAVFDDALVKDLGRAALERVIAPKARGAWHLHELTRDAELEAFVLFSSVTTSFGNPGQANYVAANTYLEGLASMRRAEGLPALAVGFGPIADAGFLTRNEALRDGLTRRMGGAPLTSREALDGLGALLATPSAPASVALVNVDWRSLARTLPAFRRARLAQLADPEADGGSSMDLRTMISGLASDAAHERVVVMLREQVASVLRLPASKVDTNASIYDLGMDSLMAAELHMSLEEKLGVGVPMMAVTEGASLSRLATRIIAQADGGTSGAQAASSVVETLAARHGDAVDAGDVSEIAAELANRATGGTRLIN